jgi:hypothetical protein
MSLTVTELAEEVRDSNRRLTQSIDSLGQKFDNLRVEIAKDFGVVNTNLESFKTRTEMSVGIARWGINLMMPLIIAALGWLAYATWYVAKMDSRLDRFVRETGFREIRGTEHAPDNTPPIPSPVHDRSHESKIQPLTPKSEVQSPPT